MSIQLRIYLQLSWIPDFIMHWINPCIARKPREQQSSTRFFGGFHVTHLLSFMLVFFLICFDCLLSVSCAHCCLGLWIVRSLTLIYSRFFSQSKSNLICIFIIQINKTYASLPYISRYSRNTLFICTLKEFTKNYSSTNINHLCVNICLYYAATYIANCRKSCHVYYMN